MAENSKNKMTEIGNLPSDWDVMSLSEIGRFSKGSGVTRDQSHSGDIPCVRYGELYTTHDNYIRSFSSFISAEVAKTATKLSKGDILFAGSGETKEEIGKAVAFVGDEEAYAGGDIIILMMKNLFAKSPLWARVMLSFIFMPKNWRMLLSLSLIHLNKEKSLRLLVA